MTNTSKTIVRNFIAISFLSLAFAVSTAVDSDTPEFDGACAGLDDMISRFKENGNGEPPKLIFTSAEMIAVLRGVTMGQLEKDMEGFADDAELKSLFDAMSSLTESVYKLSVDRTVPGCIFYNDIPLVAVSEMRGNTCTAFLPQK